MHRGRRIGVMVTLAIVLGTVAMLGGSVASGQTEISLFAPADKGKVTFVDVEGDGIGVGDRVVGRGPLLDATMDVRLGTAYGDCVMVRGAKDRSEWMCVATYELADGTLVLSGIDAEGLTTSSSAIVGGTGAYATARGDVTVSESEAGTEILIHLAA